MSTTETYTKPREIVRLSTFKAPSIFGIIFSITMFIVMFLVAGAEAAGAKEVGSPVFWIFGSGLWLGIGGTKIRERMKSKVVIRD